MTSSLRRPRASVLLVLVVLALLAPTTSASAEVDTFIRFEENATANWLVTEQCPDGSTAQTRVTVIAGREFESPDLDSGRLTFVVRTASAWAVVSCRRLVPCASP